MPTTCVERFIERSAANGIDVFRIFDALNDVRNLERAMQRSESLRQTCRSHASVIPSAPSTAWTVLSDLAKTAGRSGNRYDLYQGHGRTLGAARRISFGASAESRRQGPASSALTLHVGHGFDGLVHGDPRRPRHARHFYLSAWQAAPPTQRRKRWLRHCRIPPTIRDWSSPRFQPITEHFRTVRRKYRQFESDFTGVDAEILMSQIPGGMLSNLAAQLTEQNALDRIKEVLDEVPRVRKEMGYPPLVTPTSQIVGTQATLNVLTGERYKVVPPKPRTISWDCMAVLLDRSILTLWHARPAMTRRSKPGRLIDLSRNWMRRKKSFPIRLRPSRISCRSRLFPAIARDFFEAREKGDLTPEPLELGSAKGPATAHELHLAPVEFNVTVHGETYHVKVSGSGRKSTDVSPTTFV